MDSKRHKKSLAEKLAKYDPARMGFAAEYGAIGREFGSPDYERLMALESNLSALVKICTELAQARPGGVDRDERQGAANVQIALQELGQHVSLDVAAAVWRHYSNSILACWLSGAETPASAKDALRSYIQHAPPGGFSPDPPGPAGFD